MSEGKFYTYYKPGYANGFGNYAGQDIDFAYLQACEQVCRDEFTPDSDYIGSDEFQSALKQNHGLVTKSFAAKHFDKSFKRTYNVEFFFNTDMKELKRIMKGQKKTERPVLLLMWPELFMSQYAGELQNALREYNEMFEVFYCREELELRDVLNTRLMPKEVIHMYIIDTQTKEPLKKLESCGRDQTEMDVNYFKKYQQFVFNIAQPAEELKKFVEGFLDEKLNHYYVTEDRVQTSFVKTVNADNFESEVIKNKQFETCVIEIIKDHCPACFISKFNTNMLSRKMRKHNLLDKVPLFRMKINNQVPYLGDLPHTPLHIFLRKDSDGNVVEMKLLDSPLPQNKTDSFLQQIEELVDAKHLTEFIKLDVIAQRTKFFNMQDLEQNYDFEFDSVKGYETVTAKKKREQAAAA